MPCTPGQNSAALAKLQLGPDEAAEPAPENWESSHVVATGRHPGAGETPPPTPPEPVP